VRKGAVRNSALSIGAAGVALQASQRDLLRAPDCPGNLSELTLAIVKDGSQSHTCGSAAVDSANLGTRRSLLGAVGARCCESQTDDDGGAR